MQDIEAFGTPGQQMMQRKGEALYGLIRDDPRFCSHGRGVQISDFTSQEETLNQILALANILGASGCEKVPNDKAADLIATVEELGFITDTYSKYTGQAETIAIARQTLSDRALPKDLTLRVIDKDSPREWVEGLAEVALEQGVLPSAGPVLRGISRPGFGMVAMDESGQPVATACAAMTRHKDHHDCGMAQWGQLATRDDRKGQGIARMMAAHSIVHAADTLGTEVFSTGIRDGNAPSENLCRSLGLAPSDYTIVIVIDPNGFDLDRATK